MNGLPGWGEALLALVIGALMAAVATWGGDDE